MSMTATCNQHDINVPFPFIKKKHAALTEMFRHKHSFDIKVYVETNAKT